MSVETYLLYLVAVGIFFATPPDTSQLLIISNSIKHGLKRSKWTIAGDLSANCIQMTAAAFGLAAVIASSATAFTLVKWLGVLYLAWIGLKLFMSKDTSVDIQQSELGESWRLYKQGFFTSLANPFAVAFFAALFPQFINPADPVLPQLFILGATYLIVDGAILVAWGAVAVHASNKVKLMQFDTINKVCGGLMIVAAGLLAIKDFEPRNT